MHFLPVNLLPILGEVSVDCKNKGVFGVFWRMQPLEGVVGGVRTGDLRREQVARV